jgi:hypothetical protein
MNTFNFQAPGMHITEVNSFPNSVVGVPTAVPAFIGYTPQAAYQGKSYTNVPVKITSFADFQTYFCLHDPAPQKNPTKQYSPQYYLVQQKGQPASGDYIMINGNYYSVLPDANTIYYLYNSVQLFFQNGGGAAFIVSVGSYGPPSDKPVNPGDQIINTNVQLNDLLNGLALLQNEPEPTMYICPEATLLNVADNATLMQSMLAQSSTMRTSISIFDIIGGNDPDPKLYFNDITAFRNNSGTAGLDFGAAYYPFLATTIMQSSDIDYTNLFGGDITQLAPLVNPPANPDPNVAAILANIQNSASDQTIAQNNNALINASQTYSLIMQHVLQDANILPPSGAMAGIITTVDKSVGPWQSPANVSIASAYDLTINLTGDQQGDLNVDTVTGKSVNAIRSFPGKGILVWGARTLDGNSNDWKYLSVRRTLIFIEQSCKVAAQAYVFQPNNANTWSAITAMLNNFLTSLWSQGALQGPSAASAFSVACGLGTTMTGDDILNGILRVTIKVAVSHPAEFIVITFEQQQQVG